VKILVAALHNGYYRNIESVMEALAARGPSALPRRGTA
jgi:hypothetical protein